jgi:hypothetical protein
LAGCEGRRLERDAVRVGVSSGCVRGLAKGRCSHPPLASCIFVASFYKDLARFSRAREKKDAYTNFIFFSAAHTHFLACCRRTFMFLGSRRMFFIASDGDRGGRAQATPPYVIHFLHNIRHGSCIFMV